MSNLDRKLSVKLKAKSNGPRRVTSEFGNLATTGIQSMSELLDPLTARHDLTMGRMDAADTYKVKLGNPGVAKRLLKRLKVLPVFAGALGKEHLFGNERITQ